VRYKEEKRREEKRREEKRRKMFLFISIDKKNILNLLYQVLFHTSNISNYTSTMPTCYTIYQYTVPHVP